ncbi:hypothetical protein SAMN05444955_10531 [Lihuaxuella thermophila]|uniref:Uncharacterized protein n=1 Tax=Lihuaxuella thermophila TaxID=1173111 RepID=A0A1H8D9L0_9BACL|nr:hypothetical protein SAMN05444955_10531 [Lihuaxuella thermophila]
MPARSIIINALEKRLLNQPTVEKKIQSEPAKYVKVVLQPFATGKAL